MKKKLFIFLTIFALVITLSSCSSYHSKKGTMDELVGTYKLTAFNKEEYDSDVRVNMIEENDITAYLIVKSDGFGYYVYNDSFYAVSIDYIYDEDEIKAIEYTNGLKSTYQKKSEPGYGNETKLGFDVNAETLSYTHSKGKFLNVEYPYRYVKYEKVSTDTTLSYVETTLNKTFDDIPHYLLNTLTGLFSLSENYNDSSLEGTIEGMNKYKYVLIDVDNINQKYTAYYELINDDTENSLEKDHAYKNENLSLSFRVSSDNNHKGIVTILGADFEITLSTDGRPSNPIRQLYDNSSNPIASQSYTNVPIELSIDYTDSAREQYIQSYITTELLTRYNSNN